MRLLGICALLIVVVLFPTRGFASDIQVKDLGDGQTMIVLSGDIEVGDSARFKRAAAQLDSAIVVLESEGGTTLDAIEIGETIRIKGFSTIVVNGSYCASACGLIWLAGSPRVLTKSARVGFHATYSDKDGRKLESGVGNALVGRYFAILNLPQKAIIFATSSSPNDVAWLTPSNAASFGIEVSIVDDFRPEPENERSKNSKVTEIPPPRLNLAPAPPPITTSPRPSRAETTLWRNVGAWSVITDHTLGNSCFMIKRFEDNTIFRVGFDVKIKKQSYFMFSNTDWVSLKVGESYPISITLDDNDPWDANTTGIKLGNLVVLHASFDDTEFWGELAEAKIMRVERNEKIVGILSLGDAAPAIDQVIACQKAANELTSQRDPFSD